MNKLMVFQEPVIHPVDDEDLPNDVSKLPKIYRLTFYKHEQIEAKRTQCTATLYHDRAAIQVSWVTSMPDLRLKAGVLVSPRWFSHTRCMNGAYRISRLVLMERPEPWENLFHTVPHDWVKDRELVYQAAELIEELPRPYRMLFNAIFWEGQRFYRYCTIHTPINERLVSENGNLRRAVDVSLLAQQMGQRGEIANEPLGILAGFLHEAGRADEYHLSATGEWKLSCRGELLGHKITVIEWIAQAKVKWSLLLPEEHYLALLRCLTCSISAPEWPGGKRPTILDAILLAGMKQPSMLVN